MLGYVVVASVAFHVAVGMAPRAATTTSPARTTVVALEETVKTTEVGGLMGLFEAPASEADEEFFEALEQGLAASTQRKGFLEDPKGAAWDANFWVELDEPRLLEACDPAGRRRLRHFFRAHRVLSMAISSRNRTDAVSRVSLTPLLESLQGARQVRAFNHYAGLGTKPVWDSKQFAWLGKFGELLADDKEAGLQKELAEDVLAASFADLEEQQAASEAAFEAPPAPMREAADSTSGGSVFDDIFFDASDEDLLGLGDEFGENSYGNVNTAPASSSAAFEEAAEEEVYEDLSMLAEPHGRRQITLASYFRESSGEATLEALRQCGAPFGGRQVGIQRQAAGTRTPLHSELQGYLLTAYVGLHGDLSQAGITLREGATTHLFSEGPLVIDSTFLHSTFNDNLEDAATWAVVDFWHPDLSVTEVAALERFLKLDEQFVLRRSPTPDVVLALLNNNRPLSFLDNNTDDDDDLLNESEEQDDTDDEH